MLLSWIESRQFKRSGGSGDRHDCPRLAQAESQWADERSAGVAGFYKQAGIPLPTFLAWVVALLETAGAVLLILGLGTRILAIGYVIDMIVAIRLVRIGMAKSPFSGGQGIGWEFEFILAGAPLALLFTGAGSLALDSIVGL